jgi:hypothetical protein
LIGLAACLVFGGCDPVIVNVQQEGKCVPQSVYEYGLAWPFPHDVDPSPPPDVMWRELLAIAPVGTSRTEALRRLNAAGIKVDRAVSPRSEGHERRCPDRFVGSFWNRPQGKVWIVDFGFEFDELHKLRRVDVHPVPESAISQRLNPTDSTRTQQSDLVKASAAIPQKP